MTSGALRRSCSSLVESIGRRSPGIHTSSRCREISKFAMPAMSPTMTEGGIASWKVKEGASFSQGDILLEIETDKATIDVEAQDDGVLGKIIVAEGTKNIAVGDVIALLAEEGDDISNLEIPQDEKKPERPKRDPRTSMSEPSFDRRSSRKYSSTRQDSNKTQESVKTEVTPQEGSKDETPKHPRTLFPSVLRILLENGISDASKIKGTGIRGMLTKGDVLTHLGIASGPLGTFKEPPALLKPAPVHKQSPTEVLSGDQVRQLLVASLQACTNSAAASVSKPPATFDSVISDYIPMKLPNIMISESQPIRAPKDILDELI